MGKTIFCFKPTRIAGARVCLNCGADLRHKKHGIQFCNELCKAVYNQEHGKGTVWMNRSEYMHDVIARGN